MEKTAVDQSERLQSLSIILTGIVQGVGFRPFVYRLAQELGINGSVENNAGQVSIRAEADEKSMRLFLQRLIEDAPVISSPKISSIEEVAFKNISLFTINSGHELAAPEIHISPDLNICSQCETELLEPTNRRYQYPFINCTQCGPRFTVIKTLPYERHNTTMESFKLCEACSEEYTNPADRRFHAEPTACEVCGPELSYVEQDKAVTGNQQALSKTIEAIRAGKIVALKSTGGYHLVCDAISAESVSRLRARKQRPDKPFALLVPENLIDEYAEVSDKERSELLSPARPIVLVKKQVRTNLADGVEKGLGYIGIMLPSSPLQVLLCNELNRPLVATSANLSGEPVITNNQDATRRLQGIADAWLHNNRDISRPADDSVVTITTSGRQVVRAGRGIAPLELKLPFKLKTPVLAVGGHIKNSVALAWGSRMVISSHNGDLSSLRGFQQFQQNINDLQTLYRVRAEKVICDMHPDYASSRWAKASSLPVTMVQHHMAHASALFLQHRQEQPSLVFSWDGVGLGNNDTGSDGTLWGGETFYGTPGHWQRVLSFKPFKLPGGEKTSREAWRIAASLCWHAGIEPDSPIAQNNNSNELKELWQKNINSPLSSAAGRLFSAAAALTGIVHYETWEGHGPSLLEALAAKAIRQKNALELPIIEEEGVARIEWQPLVPMLMDNTLSVEERAWCFHETLAKTIARFVESYSKPIAVVGLSGGVFQNRLLTERACYYLEQQGVSILLPGSVPSNDGGISAGQIIESFYQ